MMFGYAPLPGRYVIAYGSSHEEAEQNAMRAGEGNLVLVQAVKPISNGGWIARGEVLVTE